MANWPTKDKVTTKPPKILISKSIKKKLKIVAKDPVIDGQTSLGWAIDQQGVVRGYYAVKGLNYYLYHLIMLEKIFGLYIELSYHLNLSLIHI